MANPPDHAINIRVMRLAKPTFVGNSPLIQGEGEVFCDTSCPEVLNGCGLGMALIVPQTFGMVHVGEDFSCLVSVFNETTSRTAEDISLKADLQTQSQRTTLQEVVPINTKVLPVGGRFDTVIKSKLADTGAHILVCNISYTVNSEKLNFRKFFRFDVRRLVDIRVRTFPSASVNWFLEATLSNATSQILWLDSIGVNIAGEAVGSLVAKLSDISKILKPQESFVAVFSINRNNTASYSKNTNVGASLQPLPGQLAMKFRSQFGDIAFSDFLTQIPSDVLSQAKLLLRVDAQSDVKIGNSVLATFHLKNVTTSNLNLNIELGTGSDFIGVGETQRLLNDIAPGGEVECNFNVVTLKPGFVNFPPVSLFVKNQHQYIRDLPNPVLTMFASVPVSGTS